MQDMEWNSEHLSNITLMDHFQSKCPHWPQTLSSLEHSVKPETKSRQKQIHSSHWQSCSISGSQSVERIQSILFEKLLDTHHFASKTFGILCAISLPSLEWRVKVLRLLYKSCSILIFGTHKTNRSICRETFCYKKRYYVSTLMLTNQILCYEKYLFPRMFIARWFLRNELFRKTFEEFFFCKFSTFHKTMQGWV